MQWVTLALAVALPLLLGATCIDLLLRRATRGRLPLLWGNGMLLGLLLTPLVMRLQDGLGAGLEFSTTVSLLCVLLIIAGVAGRLRPRATDSGIPGTADKRALATAGKILCAFFGLLIGLRLVSLGLELLWRPLYPWDATMHWATKARVWFDAGGIVPFVENQRWLELWGDGVFTDHHPDYPITIPLLQVWVANALGHWDESLVNLPWWLCLAGLGGAFYGQARAAGSPPLTALVFTYLLLSMPLLNIHVALAGYADLFLGAAYCAAIMACHNWSLSRDRGQAVLAVIFALFCPMIKNEGFFWMLTFVPALIVMLLPRRHALSLLAAGLLALLLVLIVMPADLSVAGHSLNQLRLQFRPGVAPAIATSIWLQDNWHLLGYLLAGLPLLGLLCGRPGMAGLAGIVTALLAAAALFLGLFLFTHFATGAERFTAVGRISLHLVPALMFLCLLLWNSLAGHARPGECAGAVAGRPL